MRSLLLGMIAVCGIGRPSGWRNSATTANQSANRADHRGLGEGGDVAPGRMERNQHRGRDVDHPGRGEEAERDRLHAGEAAWGEPKPLRSQLATSIVRDWHELV